jgi:hypothetical protein
MGRLRERRGIFNAETQRLRRDHGGKESRNLSRPLFSLSSFSVNFA